MYNLQSYTITIYGLWYDDELTEAFKDFSQTLLEDISSHSFTPLFKISALPKIILENEDNKLDFLDDQEYNSLYLTISTERDEYSKINEFYTAVNLYRKNQIYN